MKVHIQLNGPDYVPIIARYSSQGSKPQLHLEQLGLALLFAVVQLVIGGVGIHWAH